MRKRRTTGKEGRSMSVDEQELASSQEDVEAIDEIVSILNEDAEGDFTYEVGAQTDIFDLGFDEEIDRNSTLVVGLVCDGEPVSVVWEQRGDVANVTVLDEAASVVDSVTFELTE